MADPTCSWCWGFARVIAAIAKAHGERLPIRLVLGGLRPGTTEPVSAARAAELRRHWAQVAAAPGQPLGAGIVDEAFVYRAGPAPEVLASTEGRLHAG